LGTLPERKTVFPALTDDIKLSFDFFKIHYSIVSYTEQGKKPSEGWEKKAYFLRLEKQVKI